MSKKFSIFFTLILTVIMSVAIITSSKANEQSSDKDIFATKYNTAFNLVRQVDNFDLEKGSVGFDNIVYSAKDAINDLEETANSNFIEKKMVAEDVENWRVTLQTKMDDVYSRVCILSDEIGTLDPKDNESREAMQNKINLGFEYINTLNSLASNLQNKEEINDITVFKDKYNSYQKDIEAQLFSALEVAQADVTQENIDVLKYMIPAGFPEDLKKWYLEMIGVLQNQIMNEVIMEVEKIAQEVSDGVDKETIEEHKNQVKDMLNQFFNSSDENVRVWSEKIATSIDSLN